MQRPDLKVGKTDIIDSRGTRVITETTNQITSDGKSIWTIAQQFDYDNDGVMDGYINTTKIYDTNTDKLIEETVEEKNRLNLQGALKNNKSITNTKYLYETETGRLVKENCAYDGNGDGEVDVKSVTNYSYDSEGREVNKHEKINRYYEGAKTKKSENDISHNYHKNGEVKERVETHDYDGDRTPETIDKQVFDEHGNTIAHEQFDQTAAIGKHVVKKYDEKGRVVQLKRDNAEYTYTYNDKAGTKEIEAKGFSDDGNTLIWHDKTVVDSENKIISKTDLMPKEEPVKAEEKQGYEIPSYKPYSQDNDKKRPPMMGV